MLYLLGIIVSAVTYIIRFLKGFLIKYATHSVILGIQFAITATTITFVVGFYYFTIGTFLLLYNSSIDIVNYFVSNPDSSLSCFYGVLDAVGFTAALNNGITMFFTALSSIMIFNLFKFTYGALKAIKDEIFKLGVLLGQAVN
jgi:hypothetical protein